MRTALILLAASALAAPAYAAPAARTSKLVAPGGVAIGTIALTEAPHGVILRLEARGLVPGWHAVHFHEKGDCGDAAFKNSGGHVHTVTPAVHGLLNPDANDLGDLPNIFVAADGTANVELYSTLVSLGVGGPAALLDADGSALVIHAGPDDYTTQPIGGAGGRAACAVIK